MNLHLSGLTAVVTGGSAGIGHAVVRSLAEEGCNVFFCARDADRIASAMKGFDALQGKVSGRSLDITDKQAFSNWLAEIGPFNIFVPNVSALSVDWQQAITTDIEATVFSTEVAVPYLLRSEHAAITYIGSKAGSLPAPTSASYGASKAAMAHYMKSLSFRLLPKIRVNTISPGDTLVPGNLWGKLQADDPVSFAKVVERNPLNRLASAEEIARVVAFVSSPAASFVAGANWYVDGGSVNHVQF